VDLICEDLAAGLACLAYSLHVTMLHCTPPAFEPRSSNDAASFLGLRLGLTGCALAIYRTT